MAVTKAQFGCANRRFARSQNYYRKNEDISPLFEMGLTRCARASALSVSEAAIERRLIRRVGG